MTRWKLKSSEPIRRAGRAKDRSEPELGQEQSTARDMGGRRAKLEDAAARRQRGNAAMGNLGHDEETT
jgi:hypothetical protein